MDKTILRWAAFLDTKKVVRGHCTISRILSGTQSLGDKKEQENTVTNFVQSSVF